MGGHLLPLEEAHRRIAASAFLAPRPLTVRLSEAIGRYAAEAVLAREPRPDTPRSAMDGFAVRAADLMPTHIRRVLPGSEENPARPLERGEAVPVGTGARLPPGADAVVRREAARPRPDGGLDLLESLWPGKDVHPVGEDVRAGDLLLARGERVRPSHLGVLLEQGIRELPVLSARVGILAVGSELVPASEPAPGRTPDTISPMLAPLVPSAETSYLGTVEDEPAVFRRALERALAANDLVITVGGASVGEHDPVKPVVREMGELLFEGLRVNILKRAAVGKVGDRPVVILPGQPVAALTAFHELGLAVLERLWGVPLRRTERWPLGEALSVQHHRMDATFLFRCEDGLAHPLTWGVARYGTLARADGYAILRRGTELASGGLVEVRRFLGS